MKATINTLPDCRWCVKAKKLLEHKGIEFTEVNGKVDTWPTVPYIVIDGEVIGGFTELARFVRNL
jgi:glutaredoxin